MIKLNQMCRLCLQNNDFIEYLSIFTRDPTDSVDILTKIKILMPSLSFPEFDTEQCVCHNCLMILRQFIIFKSTSEQNAAKFINLAKRHIRENVQIRIAQQPVPLQQVPFVSIPSAVRTELPKQLLQIRQPEDINIELRKLLNIASVPPQLRPAPALVENFKPHSKVTDESIKTPKIVAVYSLQNSTAPENSNTDEPDMETIKIDDDLDDDVAITDCSHIPPILTKSIVTDRLDRISIHSDSPSPPPKLAKLAETPDCDMPDIFKTVIWKAIEMRLPISTRQLQLIIGEKFQIWPSISAIESVIKSLHYIVTRDPQTASIENSKLVLMSRLDYAQKFAKFNENKIIFAHEMNVKVIMRKPVAINPISAREFRLKAAMSRKELIYFNLVDQVHSCEDYGNWFTELLSTLKWKNIENVILITENCPSLKIENKILANGHRLVCTPPGSPFLNPLENIFLKWQRDIKLSMFLNEESLIFNMKQHKKFINQTDCEITYAKMKSFLPRCIKQIPI